ncbi:MAG: preprotein translocase subunit SecY [Erysipelotrichaceae bacterium]|nr:preprotein translocase subunit SecY [Erysipelotrichaceae bacterium]MCI9313334.1 preprotein translocase subunit SecY [Erysipelotrichaceae bacterium]
MFATFVGMLKNKEIRSRILFTLAMLFVFRFGTTITVPGVNTAELLSGMNDNSLLAMMNLLGGGGLEQLSIFALGVGPYITASIIIQLLSMDVIPALTELSKGGANGRKQIDRYTRYLAVVLSFFQGFTMVYSFSKTYPTLLESEAVFSQCFYISTLLTAGSMFLLWIGDRISMKGIGNGVSMIIMAGIVARLPHQFITAYQTLVGSQDSSAMFGGLLNFSLFVFCYVLILILVVFMQMAERKIPIQYTSSTVQTRKKDMTYLPLKINSASVIPVIFASAIMVAPLQIARFFNEEGSDVIVTMSKFLGLNTPISLTIYVVLILLFTFFYTKLQVDPEKIAENLGKNGTYIPGIRPGSETRDYITKVLNRITVLGAIGLAFIAVLPHALPLFTSLPQSMGLGGTGVIIVVGVAMETVKQLEGQLTQKSYRGFISR